MVSTIHPFIRALEQYDDLSTEERSAIEALPFRTRTYPKHAEIICEGGRPTQCCLVLEGFAARTQVLRSGRRQVTDLHITGDFVDLHSLYLKRMDHSVTAFSDCKCAFIPRDSLRQVIDEYPHLSRLFTLFIAIDAAIDRAWITCFGARQDKDHMAHFLCELFVRLQARGLTNGNAFEFGATQAELGEVLGMSAVHVNRTLQDLRRMGLLLWEGRRVEITHYEELADRAEFDPLYLNLWKEPR